MHPPLGAGPPLVHVDAYRIGGAVELDDLDLDTALEEAVTVVEWGTGVAEGLAETRLEVRITRSRGDERDAPAAEGHDSPAVGPERRTLLFTPVGERWTGAGLVEALT
jgi:tRNA threonylcarbamoyladenosine biosynthesis protein TsaE